MKFPITESEKIKLKRISSRLVFFLNWYRVYYITHNSSKKCNFVLLVIKFSTRDLNILRKEGFTILQGMALLLLKPLDLPANYSLNLIIWITNPKNKIGY